MSKQYQKTTKRLATTSECGIISGTAFLPLVKPYLLYKNRIWSCKKKWGFCSTGMKCYRTGKSVPHISEDHSDARISGTDYRDTEPYTPEEGNPSPHRWETSKFAV